jgi:hypothetical protein
MEQSESLEKNKGGMSQWPFLKVAITSKTTVSGMWHTVWQIAINILEESKPPHSVVVS